MCKASSNVNAFVKLCVLQILALAALLLLQWECVWITAEMKWPTFASVSVIDFAEWGQVKHCEETQLGHKLIYSSLAYIMYYFVFRDGFR